MSVIIVNKTADDFRQMARECLQRSRESFERSDTDGFLSQGANDFMARGYHLAAEVAEDQGFDEFLALFDLAGNLVPARLVNGKYGMTWLVLDSWDGLYEYGKGNAIAWIKPLDYEESGESVEGCPIYKPSQKSIKYAKSRGYRYGKIRMKAVVISHGGMLGGGWHTAPLRGERYEDAEIVEVI